MPIDAATIAQMEKELEDARDQLLRDDGQRYRILMREISGERGLKLHTARLHKDEKAKAAVSAAGSH